MEVKIYCIEDFNGLKYVGSTTQELRSRLYHHRCHGECMSRKLDLYNCEINTLEVTDEENRYVREQYWIDNTECVNIQSAIADDKRYYRKNKEKILEKNKKYYVKNKDEIMKQQKKYRDENKESIKKQQEQYYIDNHEKIKQRRKERYYQNQEKFIKQERQRRIIYNKLINEQRRNNRKFQLSWGGDPRTNNNLLKIDLDIFI